MQSVDLKYTLVRFAKIARLAEKAMSMFPGMMADFETDIEKDAFHIFMEIDADASDGMRHVIDGMVLEDAGKTMKGEE